MPKLGPQRLILTDNPIIEEVFMLSNKKGMISLVYSMLLSALQGASDLPCRRWRYIGSLPIGCSFGVCVSYTETIIFLLHRAYRTPWQLHRWGCGGTPLCLKCEQENGDLIHMLWQCPKLFHLWAEIISTISRIYNFMIKSGPVACLLGSLEEGKLTLNEYVAILLYFTLRAN